MRKMTEIDWLETPPRRFKRGHGRSGMKIRRSRSRWCWNLDKCIGCHTCSVTCKNVWNNREGMEYAWFNNVETKPAPRLSQGLGGPEEVERAAGSADAMARSCRASRQVARAGEHLRQPEHARDRRYYEPFISITSTCRRRGAGGLSHRSAAQPDHRRAGWRRSCGGRTGRRSSAVNSPSVEGCEFRGRAERKCTASSKTPS